jgi:hypothetical protein
LLAGCAREVTQKDVTAARQAVEEQQQQVEQARQEAAEIVPEEKTAERSSAQEAAHQQALEKVRREEAEAREAQQKLEGTEARFEAQLARDAYVKEMRGKFETADKEIEEIRQHGDDLTGEAKDAHNKMMENLDALRQTAEGSLDEVETADALKWTESRDDADRAYESLSKEIDAAT